MSDNYNGNHPNKDVNRKIVHKLARKFMGNKNWFNNHHVGLASREGKDIEYLLNDNVKPDKIHAAERDRSAFNIVKNKFPNVNVYFGEIVDLCINLIDDKKIGLIYYDSCGRISNSLILDAAIFECNVFAVTGLIGRETEGYTKTIKTCSEALSRLVSFDLPVKAMARAHSFMLEAASATCELHNFIPYALTVYKTPDNQTFWTSLFVSGLSNANINSTCLGGFKYVFKIDKGKIEKHWSDQDLFIVPNFNYKKQPKLNLKEVA